MPADVHAVTFSFDSLHGRYLAPEVLERIELLGGGS